MQTYTAKEARANFSAMLDKARNAPVTINKNGKPAAVLISAEDYARLEALEDEWWIEKAKKALKEGTIGVAASKKLTREILES